ncbi:HAD family hydrolase [Streptomyces sp. PU-14G]|uniref:HAD family hydrolase n=1 Tax=Streptomyces sp. PU-14G TaxID=2800808 RepID=UPI0034DFA67E
MTPGRPQAVLFDLDDTLIEYAPAAAREREAVTEAVRDHLPTGAVAGFLDRFDAYLFRHHAEVDTGRVPVAEFRDRRLRHAMRPWHSPDSALCRRVAACADATAASVGLAAGAAAVLAALRDDGVRVGIVTNGPLGIQTAKCTRLGLTDAVDTLVTSQDVGRTKPDGEVFHEALRRLGVRPGAAVVVGDSWENDVLGGLRAGLAGAVHIGPDRGAVPAPPGLLGRAERAGDEVLHLLEDLHA